MPVTTSTSQRRCTIISTRPAATLAATRCVAQPLSVCTVKARHATRIERLTTIGTRMFVFATITAQYARAAAATGTAARGQESLPAAPPSNANT
jgi:hypothetical protein